MKRINRPIETVNSFVVGWEEWLALPDLELPAIRAKIDTGAKTSALHAFAIEPYGPASAPMVRFGIHPIPGREDIARVCSAAVIDRREVTSSNGEKESRFVIRTRLLLGDRDWGEIETTLTNREGMAYRMLLGRQAIRGGLLVDPAASFLQPKLSARLYAAMPRQTLPQRSLRLAIVATKPERPSNLRLQQQARSRGHTCDIIPLATLSLDFGGSRPGLILNKRRLPPYDAVIARAGGGMPGFAAAVVQAFQQCGAATLNPADAIERLRNPYLVASRLHAHDLPLPEHNEGIGADGGTRHLIVLGDVIATRGKASIAEQRVAARIATALELGIVAVAFMPGKVKPRLVGLDPQPPLSGYQQAEHLARAIIAAIETRVRTPAAQPSPADDA